MRVCHFRLPETRHRNSPDRTVLNSKNTGFGEKRGISYLGTKPLGWMSGYWWKDNRTTRTGGVRTVKTPSIAAEIHPLCLWEQRTNDSRKNAGIIPAGLGLHVCLQLVSEKPPDHALSSQTACWCRTESCGRRPFRFFHGSASVFGPTFLIALTSQWHLEINLMVSEMLMFYLWTGLCSGFKISYKS